MLGLFTSQRTCEVSNAAVNLLLRQAKPFFFRFMLQTTRANGSLVLVRKFLPFLSSYILSKSRLTFPRFGFCQMLFLKYTTTGPRSTTYHTLSLFSTALCFTALFNKNRFCIFPAFCTSPFFPSLTLKQWCKFRIRLFPLLKLVVCIYSHRRHICAHVSNKTLGVNKILLQRGKTKPPTPHPLNLHSTTLLFTNKE